MRAIASTILFGISVFICHQLYPEHVLAFVAGGTVAGFCFGLADGFVEGMGKTFR